MAEINIPDSVLETFRCSLCRRYLSSAPILVLTDGNSICSVCSRSAEQPTYRVLALEVFLSKLSFPCQYTKYGCKGRVSFGQVDEHQDNCAHRPCSCPALTNCAWEGSAVDIFQHFTEKHSNLIKQNAEFKLQVDQDKEGIFIFMLNDVYFIFKYKYNATSSNFGYDVRFLTNIQEAAYRIRLTNNSDCDYYCAIKGGNTLPYNRHFNSMQDSNIVTLNYYMQVLNNPNCIMVTVNATVITKFSQDNTFAEELKVNYELLQLLRCGKCQGYLMPPLYDSCYGTICCHCKGTFCIPSRNSELKQCVGKMNFPCRWQGCVFIGKPENLLEHDSGCQFRTFNCAYCENTFTWADALVHLQNHGHEYFTGMFRYKMVLEKLYFQKTLFTFKDNEIIFVGHDKHRVHTLESRCTGSCSSKVTVEFMHDHCKAKSEAFSLTYGLLLTVGLDVLPDCFKSNEEITVAIKI